LNTLISIKTIHGIKCNEFDRVSFHDIHKLSNRATPKMYLNYSTSLALYRIYHTTIPENIWLKLQCNLISQERNFKLLFKTTCKTKIGLQCFSNRVAHCTKQISIDLTRVSYPVFKKHCKEKFLKFT